MNLEELIVRLSIEEEKVNGGQFGQAKVNVVESSLKTNKKRKHFGNAPMKDNKKNAKKFKSDFYNCIKAGHHASEPKKQKAQTNVTESDALSEVIQKLNLYILLFLNATILEILENGSRHWFYSTHLC
ncbi:Retrovirus-related Pol polyprotein from transposon TNT 1-94 [Abeliophyllum distichum]|uniref:Retrovirus-related Pol polyprotein from transposon TNT 1-94 n=1 Tax=Abeliophyllum distichum TaxID=126358 RepID=A0ABD1TIR3_9LAMI